MIRSVLIVYASTSGHTEYVIDAFMKVLEGSKVLRCSKQRAESSKPQDLEGADVLLLAASTWNTNNVEGQLNPHMFDLLVNRSASANLKGKAAAAIGLGDERYFFRARAGDYLTEYLQNHGAVLLLPTLKIINEPYGQEDKVTLWAQEFAKAIAKLPMQS